ncbi:MAG: putative bifunctional diguanylate cyclase/phosphodiesterase [Limnohabitans sp.]
MDLDKIMTTLNFPDDLNIKFSLSPFVETASDLSKHSEAFKFEWNDDGKDYAIHIQLQQSYLSAFLFVMTGLGASLACGGLLFFGLRRWTRLFSERTTRRLDDLVQLASDTFGHDQGDEVIRQIAQHLKAKLPTGNFLCRRSGDEFIAVLDVHEPIADFQDKLKLIFKPAVFNVNHMGTVHITATFSAGAALFPDHSRSIHELLIYADTALLSAKESGRNQIQWLNAQMLAATSRKTKVDSKLAVAIREGRIFPHYQAEVDLLTGKIIGVEALARWHDEELGMVSPAEFIPLAEQSGAIDPLTQNLFAQIIQDSRAIRTRFPGATIALNSSPQLLSGKRLLTMLTHLASELDNGLDGFVLEITETDFALSAQELASQLQAIMGLGVRIAIDDFGKSYSSLFRLASMPIQKLKIDMSFTAGMEREENIKIISGILALAQSLRLEVTAEGVENRFQQDTLIKLGCQQAQGFFYSKPLSLQELLTLPDHLVPAKTP